MGILPVIFSIFPPFCPNVFIVILFSFLLVRLSIQPTALNRVLAGFPTSTASSLLASLAAFSLHVKLNNIQCKTFLTLVFQMDLYGDFSLVTTKKGVVLNPFILGSYQEKNPTSIAVVSCSECIWTVSVFLLLV